MSDTKVVILAAGKGTRMKSEVPKPLVKIAGKPMITHLIERVKEAGIDARPVVVVAPDGLDLFKAELGERVEYALQTEQLGTGHALQSAQEACGDAKHIILLLGDHPFLRPEAIRSLDTLARENPVALVMLTAVVPHYEGDYAGFKAWGRVLRSGNRVEGIVEAKDSTPEQFAVTEVSPSMYAFPAPWIWETLPKIRSNNVKGEYYLTDTVGIAMAEHKPILTAPVDALQVIAVNTPDELMTAEKVFLDQD